MEEDFQSSASSFPTKHHHVSTSHHLRHVESLSTLPSGAGRISGLNAIILGESLASEENDLVFPSESFSSQAHIPNPQKVSGAHTLVLHSCCYPSLTMCIHQY